MPDVAVGFMIFGAVVGLFFGYLAGLRDGGRR